MTTAAPLATRISRSTRAPIRWTSPIGIALSAHLARRARHLSKTTARAHDARPTQINQLRALMRLAADTEVGRNANFTRALSRNDNDLIRARRIAERKINEFAHARELTRQLLRAAAAELDRAKSQP